MTRLASVALAVLALSLGACGGGDDEDAAPEPGHVDVVDNEFEPSEITVAAGDEVTWDFEGAAMHNVTFDDEDLESSENQKDGTFEQTFEDAGSYDYVCTLHPGMDGTVVVE